jgi:hypothetical protein
VDQASQEKPWVALDGDPGLPRLQNDRAKMLATRPMLGEQTWPMLRMTRDLNAPDLLNLADTIRQQGSHRGLAFANDVGVFLVQCDSELVGTR